MKKVLAFVLTLVLVVGAMASLVSCGKDVEKQDIVIGLSGPLTGPAAIYGTAVKNSAEMAAEEINAAGGVNGCKVVIKMYDDEHDATKVGSGYAWLVDQGMNVSLGTVTSKPCLTFKSYASEDNLFCITPSATNDDVPKNAANMYQMCFSDSGQGAAAASYFQTYYSAKTIGIFYKSDDAYSNGIKDQFMANFQGTVAQENIVSFTDSTSADFSSQISALSDCDVIFMPIYYTPASVFMTQAQSSTISKDAVFFGCDGFDGITSLEGFNINDIAQKISFLSHFDSNAKTGIAGEFVTKYTSKYGSDTLNQFGAAAYDCVKVLAKAIAQTDLTGANDVSEFCEALKTIFQNASFTFSGTTGENMKWNADGTVSKVPLEYTVKEKTVTE